MAFLTGALNPTPGETPTETSDEVLVEACRSLVSMAEALPEQAPEYERILRDALTLSDQGKLLGRLRKATPHVLGVVFNSVDVRAQSYQYYYYYPQRDGGKTPSAPEEGPETPAKA